MEYRGGIRLGSPWTGWLRFQIRTPEYNRGVLALVARTGRGYPQQESTNTTRGYTAVYQAVRLYRKNLRVQARDLFSKRIILMSTRTFTTQPGRRAELADIFSTLLRTDTIRCQLLTLVLGVLSAANASSWRMKAVSSCGMKAGQKFACVRVSESSIPLLLSFLATDAVTP